MSAPPHVSSLEEELVACPMPKALDGSLDKAWMLPAEQGRLLLNLLYKEDPTGASSNTGEGLLAYLTGLMSQGTKVTEGIYLLGIKEYGQVSHTHSLF